MMLIVKKPRLHREASISEAHTTLCIHDTEGVYPIELRNLQIRHDFKNHLAMFSPRPSQLVSPVLETFLLCALIQPINALRAMNSPLLICGLKRIGLDVLIDKVSESAKCNGVGEQQCVDGCLCHADNTPVSCNEEYRGCK